MVIVPSSVVETMGVGRCWGQRRGRTKGRSRSEGLSPERFRWRPGVVTARHQGGGGNLVSQK